MLCAVSEKRNQGCKCIRQNRKAPAVVQTSVVYQGRKAFMNRTDPRYQAYVHILQEELLPAMGCTEPIAVAYAAALARDILGAVPTKMEVRVSGNILKNVKSVIVPNTGHMRGIPAAAAAGALAGDAQKELEVIASVTKEQQQEIHSFLESHPVEVGLADTDQIFYIDVRAIKDSDVGRAVLSGYHTNVVLKEKNGRVLFQKDENAAQEESPYNEKDLLSVEEIVDFADSVEIEDIREIVQRQIDYNLAIAEEGLKGNYGANIGSVLLHNYGDDVKIRAKAYAAAGSDARMNGCELPVVIVSGSGNQGITASVPVVVYAKELAVSHDKLLRAVALSDLVTIHQKSGIGRLSAYCGAISAGCGAGAGIAYLYGGGYREIAHTVVNALAINSGVVCDGAKASCAAKIASGVDAGILGYWMYRDGNQFRGGDGIVSKGVENTIHNVGRLARDGMKETDKEIIQIMLG